MTRLVWNKTERTALFHKETGSLADYAWYGRYADRYEARPADNFTATLKLVDYERGRAAWRFIWEDVNNPGRKYPMFMSSAFKLIQNGFSGAGIENEWKIVKKGANYGIEVVK